MPNRIKSLVSKLMSRREFVKKTALASGAAASLGSLSLPFKAQAKTTGVPENEEQIRYSACLVNCGSRCPFKVHVKDGRRR